MAKLALAAALATFALGAVEAHAFELEGHEVIEAAAYNRLLALDVVPGAGIPGVSGRTLLATLIATGVLAEPPCFNRTRPFGDCGPDQRLDSPLEYWPLLRSGGPDLVLDRQLGQRGQCQHFMAHTADGMTPVDPRFGVPRDLVTEAYRRCVLVAGLVFDGILRDPRRATWRVAGTYVLMHGIEDSFSAAHVDRDDHGAIIHLLSWSLIDWPSYLVHGRWSFDPATHHKVSDKRDRDYLRWESRTKDGRPCRAFEHPYAVPPECLTDRAQAASDAVFDYLVLLYRLRTPALAAGATPTILVQGSVSRSLWEEFVRAHLASAAESADVPTTASGPPPRPDVFLAAQVSAGRQTWGAGLWGARLLFGPAVPFVLGPTLAAGYTHDASGGQLTAAGGLALLLPLVQRFAIGATPAALQVACDPHVTSCAADVVARLGSLIVPVGRGTWLGVEGPVWSWTERRVGDTWAGLAIGVSQERLSDPPPIGADALTAWDPPAPAQVHYFRGSRWTRLVYLATTAASQPENAFIGAGLEVRLDRDHWNQRRGFGLGLQLEVDAGNIEAVTRGGALALAPVVRYYILPDRLAVAATPALTRAGALGGSAFAVDVAARAGIVLDVGRMEISLDSPPLSYVARSRWDALPLTVRLGLSLE